MAHHDTQARRTVIRRCSGTGRSGADLPRPDPSLDLGEPLTLNQAFTDPASGKLILKLVTATLDPATQTRHLVLAYDETDATGIVHRTVASFQVHYFFRYEVELLLDKAGFAVEAIYGSYDLDPYESAGERMIFVARPFE